MKKNLRFLQIAVLFGSTAIHAHAASGTWTNTATGGLWNATGNWTDGTVADGVGFTGDFSTVDITADNVVQLNTPRTLGSVVFGDVDTATAAGWVLDNNAVPANILTLSGTPTLTVNALGTGKTATVSAIVAGSSGLTKAGVGMLVLSGANTYTGGTTITGGTIGLSNSLALGAAANPITVASGNTGALDLLLGGTFNTGLITLNGTLGVKRSSGGAVATALSGALSGSGTLEVGNTQSGTVPSTTAQGRFNMNSTTAYNAFTGSLRVLDGGNLTLFNGTLLAANNNNVTIDAGGYLSILGTGGAAVNVLSGGGWVTKNAGVNTATLTVASGTFSGVIAQDLLSATGTVALTKTTAGTLILTGANTYTGTTTISGGTLQIGNGGTTGSLASNTVVNNAILAYNYSNAGVAILPTALTGSGALTATARDIRIGANITQSGSLSFIQSGGGGLYQGIESVASATLTGSSITVTGDTGKRSSNGNTLTLSTSAVNGPINLNTSLGRNNVWYNLSSFTADAGTGTINVTGTGPISAGWSGTPVILTGAVNVTANVTGSSSLTVNASAPGTISSVLSGSLALVKQGSSTLTLTGTNTTTGATSINAGKLILNYSSTASSVLASTSALQTRGGELVFDNLGAKNQTFASTSIVSGITSKLTQGVGYTTGVVNLGTMSRTTGSLDISSITAAPGWIKATGNLSTPVLLYGAVTTNNGASLVGTDGGGFLVTAASVDHSRGGAIATGAGIVRLIETGTGPNTTAAAVTLSGANGSTTDITSLINSYTTASATPDTGLTLDIGATKILRLSATGYLSTVGGTSLTLTNGTLTSGGALDTAGVLTIVAGSPITIDSVIADNGTGIVNLMKIGPDTLTLSGSSSNTYTGTTTVNGGVLLLAKTGGAVAVAGNMNIANLNSAVVIMGADNQVASTSTLSFSGTTENGRFNLMGTAQTLAGISETNGKGVVQNAESPYTVANTGTSTLTLNVTGTPSFNGYLRGQSGTLGLIKTGAGTQTLSGANINYTGTTALNNGRITLVNTSGFRSSTTIASGATLEENVTSNFSVGTSFTISGNGTVVKSGAAQMTSGSSGGVITWAMSGGLIDVQAGTLLNDYANQTVTWVNNKASMNIATGATVNTVGGNLIYVDALTGGGTMSNTNNWGVGVVTVGTNNGSGTFSGVLKDAAGLLAITKTGTGAETLSGANTYTGPTSINGGQLILDYTTPASVLGATPLQTRGGELVFTNLGSKTQTLPSATVVSGVSKITLGGGYSGGVVNLGTLARTGGTLDIASITGTPGWIKASGTVSSALLFDGSITTNGGTTPLATDADGFLIIAATSDWSRGGSATPTGLLRLAANGSGPNTPALPISLAALPGSTIDVSGIFNGYSAATAAPDTSVTLDVGTGKTLRLAAAGSIQSFAGTDLVISNGTLTAGGADNTAGTITVNAVNNISIDSAITNNGTGAVNLVKIGTGTLTLSGANTYTGSTTLSVGTLALSGGDNRLPATGNLLMAVGTTLSIGADTNQSLPNLPMDANGTYAITGGGSLAITSGTVFAVGNVGFTTNLNLSNGTTTFTPTLYIGRSVVNSNTYQANGAVTVATGSTLNASTINIGYSSYSGGNFAPSSVGALTVNGTVQATTLTLVDLTTANHGTSGGVATVNLNAGGTLVAQTIRPGASQAGTITRTFNFNGGTIKNYDASTNLTINAFAGSTHTFTLGAGTPTFEISSGRSGSVSEPMLGTGSLTKTGEGILNLAAASTYSGGTSVNTGILLVSNTAGSATGTGAVTVKTGTFLGGKGIVTGAVSIESGGTLSPGVSLSFPFAGQPIATLSTGDLTLPAGATLEMETSTALSLTDSVAVTGNVTLGGTLTFAELASPSIDLIAGSKLTLISYTGTLTGTFAGLAENAIVDAGNNRFKIHYNDSNKVTLEVQPRPYDIWAAAKGLTSGNNGMDLDADNDGLKNLIEFYLNGNPLDGKPTAAPAATTDEDYLILTFDRATAAISQVGLTAAVQYGSDLNGWAETAIDAASSGPDANGVIVNVVDHPSAPSTITVKIPKDYAPDGKLFGRLKVQR